MASHPAKDQLKSQTGIDCDLRYFASEELSGVVAAQWWLRSHSSAASEINCFIAHSPYSRPVSLDWTPSGQAVECGKFLGLCLRDLFTAPFSRDPREGPTLRSANLFRSAPNPLLIPAEPLSKFSLIQTDILHLHSYPTCDNLKRWWTFSWALPLVLGNPPPTLLAST